MEEDGTKRISKRSDILIALLVMIIIVFLIASSILIVSYATTNIQREVYLNSVNPFFGRMYFDEITMKYSNASNFDEARVLIAQARAENLKKVNDAKFDGEVEVLIENIYRQCENGTTIGPVENQVYNRICEGGSDKGVRGDTKYILVKTNETDYVIQNLFSSAMINTLGELILMDSKPLENSREITASMLLTIHDAVSLTLPWAEIYPTINERYQEETVETEIKNYGSYNYPHNITKNVEIRRDLKEEINFYERWANEMIYPAEEEIKNINFKSYCLNFSESENDLFEGELLRFNWVLDKLTIGSSSKEKICGDFEKRKIANLLEIRKKVESEQNPFQKIIYKSVLLTNVDCTKKAENFSPGEYCTKKIREEFSKVSQ